MEAYWEAAYWGAEHDGVRAERQTGHHVPLELPPGSTDLWGRKGDEGCCERSDEVHLYVYIMCVGRRAYAQLPCADACTEVGTAHGTWAWPWAMAGGACWISGLSHASIDDTLSHWNIL